ncbi:unnamed protein product [Arctogadus glacialis]
MLPWAEDTSRNHPELGTLGWVNLGLVNLVWMNLVLSNLVLLEKLVSMGVPPPAPIPLRAPPWPPPPPPEGTWPLRAPGRSDPQAQRPGLPLRELAATLQEKRAERLVSALVSLGHGSVSPSTLPTVSMWARALHPGSGHGALRHTFTDMPAISLCRLPGMAWFAPSHHIFYSTHTDAGPGLFSSTG